MTNLFGTDGIRTTVGLFPLTPEELHNLAKAIGTWTSKQIYNPKILISNDTRMSSALIKNLIKAGLLQNKLEIFDAQILPTPAVYQLVQKQKLFDFGIVITASHNKYQDNGLKIICQYGKLSLNDEIEISGIFKNKKFKKIDYEQLGQDYFYPEAKKNYIKYLNNFFESEFLKNIKIILDCANGATSFIAPEVFESFGAKVITIYNEPNGKNINDNCGSTHPENLQNAVTQHNANIGFAFDGDGDRIIVVNKNGKLKDGDDILEILSQNVKYQNQNIVGTIVTNFSLEKYLNKNNKKLIRAPVGDKYVLQKLIEENLLLGGEQSGHIIQRDYLDSSDGIFTALFIIQEIKKNQNWNFETTKKFIQEKNNIKIDIKRNLNEEPFSSIIDKYEKQIQPGRLIVRYSGTEPLLRIVIESEKKEIAQEILQNISQDLKKEFLMRQNNEQFTKNLD